MHQRHYPFQSSFWPPNATTEGLPDFSYGLNVLHQKLEQSVQENRAIAEYLKQRIEVEKQYASQLAMLSNKPLSNDAFEKDDGAGLKKCFEMMRTESGESHETHRRRAENLTSTALHPIENFASRYQRIITQTKKSMDQRIHHMNDQYHAMEQAKAAYINKCRALQTMYPAGKAPDNIFWLDRWMFKRKHLAKLLQRLLYDIDSAVSGKLIVDRVTTYCRDTNDQLHAQHFHSRTSISSAETSLDQLYDSEIRFPQPEQDAHKVCQALLQLGFLKPQRSDSTEFSGTEQEFYTIQQLDISMDDCRFDDYELSTRASGDSSLSTATETTTGLGGIFGRWQKSASLSSSHSTQIEAREAVYQEMLRADHAYRESVKQLEQARMQTEEALFLHFEEMESLELERIQTIKQAFISVAATMSNSIPISKEIFDRMMLYQETLKPDKDVQYIVEQYRTGRFCPRPFVYTNYFYGSAMDQLFGVSLEEFSRAHKSLVPPLISQGLAAIESGFSHIYKEERSKIWTTELELDRTHQVRERLNIPSLCLDGNTEHIERYDIMLLASVIRLYLMELPDCLVTYELYDPVKQLYTNQHLDNASRLKAICKLLITLPSANFYTLQALFKHFHRLLTESQDETENEALLQGLASTFSYIITRPQTDTNLTQHDRHPQRLVRDIIVHYNDIFSKETLEAHQEYANRRAIIATPTDKAPSLDGRSSSASSNSSLHLITPTRTQFESTVQKDSETTTFSQQQQQHSPTPARSRTLLSFMRRSSSTNTQNNVRRSNSTAIANNNGSSRRPIPIPSSSTLFEDPDERKKPVLSPPPPAAAAAPAPEKPTVSKGSAVRSRASSMGTVNIDDEGSLDSFFKDE